MGRKFDGSKSRDIGLGCILVADSMAMKAVASDLAALSLVVAVADIVIECFSNGNHGPILE